MRPQITGPNAGGVPAPIVDRSRAVAARIRRFNAGIESAVLRELRLRRLKQADKGRPAR